MIALYNELIYKPLFNLAVFFYNILPGNDLGVAIIVLTVLVRIAFFPLTKKTIRSQKALSELAPKIQEIKEKFKNDQTSQSAAIMKLYKENGINPAAGCLPMLIQIPILFALYKVFMNVAAFNAENSAWLYGFISNPGSINKMFAGFLDLTSKNPLLAILAGVLQFIQAKEASPRLADKKNAGFAGTTAFGSQMLYFFPIMIIIIGWNLPAGLMLYWITATAFSIFEQRYIKNRQ
ncbi:MAG: hypothetical protein A2746_01090 [Candidatus Yanofskybacteria bacterium RIFCSPHIGHO2_01_FULL_44_22]|uniref:Membrane insertase YidC/Oxa/ALB C-terminal domain-containing protein n=1 Tax=Candidatus Yanofskybacteria bacterium RIFCSPHIGHO2_01_FULL_44_22 TaxID=1802669 RepID=A0A1F8EY25_9BACT|nr:MAG: hypothetical protein A2746_01090 [Candidatus Yanofskybacteria bacterium RIFCSPHIGHO2_01_FULL_44_22]